LKKAYKSLDIATKFDNVEKQIKIFREHSDLQRAENERLSKLLDNTRSELMTVINASSNHQKGYNIYLTYLGSKVEKEILTKISDLEKRMEAMITKNSHKNTNSSPNSIFSGKNVLVFTFNYLAYYFLIASVIGFASYMILKV
jgi:hypothetical protein